MGESVSGVNDLSAETAENIPPKVAQIVLSSEEKLLNAYIADIEKDLEGLSRYENYIQASKEYQEIKSKISNCRSKLSSIPAEHAKRRKYELEELEVLLDIKFADLHLSFSILEQVKLDRYRIAGEAGVRLAYLIKNYEDELGIYWPKGCYLLGRIHDLLGNRQFALASYGHGLSVIKATGSIGFENVEIEILKEVDRLGNISTIPEIPLKELAPKVKRFVDKEAQLSGIYWLIGSSLLLFIMIGILGFPVAIYKIYKARVVGIESYGELNANQIS